MVSINQPHPPFQPDRPSMPSFDTSGPCIWVEAEDDHGNAFFHNTSSGQSQAKHPMDDYFSALVVEERGKLPRRRAALMVKSKAPRGKGRQLYARTLWMQFEEPAGPHTTSSFPSQIISWLHFVPTQCLENTRRYLKILRRHSKMLAVELKRDERARP